MGFGLLLFHKDRGHITYLMRDGIVRGIAAVVTGADGFVTTRVHPELTREMKSSVQTGRMVRNFVIYIH